MCRCEFVPIHTHTIARPAHHAVLTPCSPRVRSSSSSSSSADACKYDVQRLLRGKWGLVVVGFGFAAVEGRNGETMENGSTAAQVSNTTVSHPDPRMIRWPCFLSRPGR